MSRTEETRNRVNYSIFTEQKSQRLEKDFKEYMKTGNTKSYSDISNVDQRIDLIEHYKKNPNLLPPPQFDTNQSPKSLFKLKDTMFVDKEKEKKKKLKPSNGTSTQQQIPIKSKQSSSTLNSNNILIKSPSSYISSSSNNKSKSTLYEKFKIHSLKLIFEMLGILFIEMFRVISIGSTTNQTEIRYVNAFTNAFTYMGFTYLFVEVCGAQFNPTISLTVFLIRNSTKWNKSSSEGGTKKKILLTGSDMNHPITTLVIQFFYIIFQFIGTLLGTYFGILLIPRKYQESIIPLPLDPKETSSFKVFIVETLISIPMLMVFISTNKTNYQFKPIYTGFIIFVLSLIAFNISGASMNPFRWIISMFLILPPLESWIYTWSYVVSALVAPFIAWRLNYFLE